MDWWVILLIVLVVLLLLILTFIVLKPFIFPSPKWCRSHQCLVGKTALITGGNTGMGFETALDFAKRGAKLIIACRDPTRAEEARKKIIERTNNRNVYVKLADMSSFESIKNLAREMNEEERLDILVNNAGILFGYGDKTVDGFDLVMQVNYYSIFLLTNLLLELMKKSGENSRIVNVSSLGAKYGSLDINNLDKNVGNMGTYSKSKLCNILFTKELAKRLQGTKVTAYSLDPGTVKTEADRTVRGNFRRIFKIMMQLFYTNVEEGAQTTIYCSVEENIEENNGCHFCNCAKIDDYKSVKNADDSKLWEETEKIVGLNKKLEVVVA